VILSSYGSASGLEKCRNGSVFAHPSKIDDVRGDMLEDPVEGDRDLDARGALRVEEDIAILGGGLANPDQAADAVAAVDGERSDHADGVALADHGDCEAGRGVRPIHGECGGPLGQPGVGLEGEAVPATRLPVQAVPFRFDGLEAGAVVHYFD
jgi:hypothetical protein